MALQRIETVAFVGTGIMGAPIARHILDAGYRVVVNNRTRAKTDALVAAGAVWAPTPAEAVRHADVVFTMLGFPDEVEDVYLATDGILRALREKKTWYRLPDGAFLDLAGLSDWEELADAAEGAQQPEEETPQPQVAAKPDFGATGEIRLDEDEEESPEDNALSVIIAEEIQEELQAMGVEDEDAGVYRKELTDEEKDVFAYFTPIEGMEAALARIIDGTKNHLLNDAGSKTGNIIIQGGKGSGKSTLCTDVVRLLQKEIHLPAGNVGKIDGAKLNEKNVVELFQKIQGGCLMIENAGKLERETVLNLSLIMDSDTSGILVILEDTRMGIDRVLSYNPNFTKKFTQRIEIPILSIDELVNFGKTYAADLGYIIDEMGVLALYNEINLIQRLDHPTYLTEVKEIVDSAINNASAGGIKGVFGRLGTKRYDESGNIILHEKDFQSQY